MGSLVRRGGGPFIGAVIVTNNDGALARAIGAWALRASPARDDDAARAVPVTCTTK